MITDASAFLSKKDESLDYGSLDRDFDFSPRKTPGKASSQQLSFSEFLKLFCGSEFTLCPAGNEQWGHRLHQAILCMSIPVVENEQHTWRNHVESLMQFHYVTPDQSQEYDYDKALEKRDKLLRHMTFTKD